MIMKKTLVTLILTGILILAGIGPAMAGNPNPGVIPNQQSTYADLGAMWYQWTFTFSAAETPYFNTGGPVDISAHQSGNVWFLAGEGFGQAPVSRTGTIPTGKQLFFPLVDLVNDYPCPDPTFQPAPGETMEQFLQRTGNEFLDLYFVPDPTKLFAEIDGVSLADLSSYRATSPMFTFTADPALVSYDPCITGTPQEGVAVGYFLLVPPLTPGTHILHFGDLDAGQDITYYLTVMPGN
jgi:hypothetical protein